VRKPRKAVPNQTLRLVKTWLPTSLVREMDETILASGGAYNGRDDFIREAITDRIAEERLRPAAGGPAAVILRQASAKSNEPPTSGGNGTVRSQPAMISGLITRFGDHVPTLPPHTVGGILYGIHNRDYPTLWAAHSLANMAISRGGPVPWSEFVSNVVEAAWKIGGQLAKADNERAADEMKASVGFPVNIEKRQSSEARFVEHMLGNVDRGAGPTGPLFAMQLLGAVCEGTDFSVGLTERGKGLLEALAALGLAARPPHSHHAWRVFREHHCSTLPADHAAWLAVLRVLAERPTREDLVRRFAEKWSGAAAATNVAGYVSRAREWGLVEPKLSDGRYVLTELGRNGLEESSL